VAAVQPDAPKLGVSNPAPDSIIRRFPGLALAEDPDELSWESGLAVRELKEPRVSW
jgi:hypothetical protein